MHYKATVLTILMLAKVIKNSSTNTNIHSTEITWKTTEKIKTILFCR